jgi:hypothetical protein
MPRPTAPAMAAPRLKAAPTPGLTPTWADSAVGIRRIAPIPPIIESLPSIMKSPFGHTLPISRVYHACSFPAAMAAPSASSKALRLTSMHPALIQPIRWDDLFEDFFDDFTLSGNIIFQFGNVPISLGKVSALLLVPHVEGPIRSMGGDS